MKRTTSLKHVWTPPILQALVNLRGQPSSTTPSLQHLELAIFPNPKQIPIFLPMQQTLTTQADTHASHYPLPLLTRVAALCSGREPGVGLGLGLSGCLQHDHWARPLSASGARTGGRHPILCSLDGDAELGRLGHQAQTGRTS